MTFSISRQQIFGVSPSRAPLGFSERFARGLGRGRARLLDADSSWTKSLCAFLAGAAGSLALAPFDFFPAMFVPMTASVALIDATALGEAASLPSGRAFLASGVVGWWLGFGYFLAGAWWLWLPFSSHDSHYFWLAPIMTFGVPALYALPIAGGFALARLFWSGGALRLFALAAALGAMEWLRGSVFAVPWNSLGMALGGNLVLAQLSSIVGLDGLTILAVILFAAPAALGSRRPGLACSAGGLAVLALFGALRLAEGPDPVRADVRLRIVQPNIAHGDQAGAEDSMRVLDHYLRLSGAPIPSGRGSAEPTHFIWPENAFPFVLDQDETALSRIGAFLGDGRTLVTGTARVDDEGAHYLNAIEIVDHTGAVLDVYDKARLFPFGEYVPFGGILTALGLESPLHIPIGFTPGPPRRALNIPGVGPAAALICFEILFSGDVTPTMVGTQRPRLLLNLSSDAWFGLTNEGHQHFSQARLRAIEEGLPMIRAANTGISAIVDAHGRVLDRLELGAEGVIDGNLPLASAPTFYALHPKIGPGLLLAAAFAGALWGRRRDRKRRLPE